jgi:acetylglutamate kinase
MTEPVVLKLSGKVSDSSESLMLLAREIGHARERGQSLVVVHGGGKQLDQLCAALGVQPKTVAGRRVTDEKTIHLAKLAFSGVNADVTAALLSVGVPAVGIAAFSGQSLRLERRPPSDVLVGDSAERVDWGFVGDVSEVDGALLKHLILGGFVPVVSSLGVDRSGTILNINADTVAVAVASAVGASRIVMAGDTDGVFRTFGDPSSHLQILGLAEAKSMLASGEATGGMLPKLSAVSSWLEEISAENVANAAAREVHIVSGLRDGEISRAALAQPHAGTVIAAR